MVCPANTGRPVVDGPATAANGSAVAATPTDGAGLIRAATVAETFPVTRWKVPVSSPPLPMLTAVLLVEFVLVPPPTTVRRVLPFRVNVLEVDPWETTMASPLPERASPATARTDMAVAPEPAPNRNLGCTRPATATSMNPGGAGWVPLAGAPGAG